jgi:tripartite-type tricarboxylate transporter receptor subunit TctC
MMQTKKGCMIFGIITLIAVFGLTIVQNAAAAWPEKPITISIPFSAGGSTDGCTRALAPGMEKVLGQQIVLINKTGGTGTVALGILAGKKPDGYYFSVGTSSGIFRFPVQRKVSYKPLASFTNIYAFAFPPSGTIVRADAPWKTWEELIAYAKANPGKIKYSSMGTGSPLHVGMSVAGKMNNIVWTHIPYKGSAPAITALLGGHVDAAAIGPEFKSMVKSGQVRILVTYNAERMEGEFANVPTLIEKGVNYINDTYFGLFGPAGVDPAIVKKIEEALDYAVDTPLYKQTAERFGFSPVKMRHEKFTKILEEGWPKQVKIFQDLGRIKEPATPPR